jgi:cbb3-type cytochrome oxidase maturation protein
VNVIFILIAVSLLVAIGFLISFIWSIRAGQFEDEYTPSVRILFDDEKNVIDDQKDANIKNSKFQIPNFKEIPKNKNSKYKPNKYPVPNPQESIPRTNNQEPRTNNQEPRTKNQEPILWNRKNSTTTTGSSNILPTRHSSGQS